ncbi:MAG: hypothetical protein VX899_23480 [Myxococcota bacterium]|nr:hypothetical protein [Myxococcota bacterium]
MIHPSRSLDRVHACLRAVDLTAHRAQPTQHGVQRVAQAHLLQQIVGLLHGLLGLAQEGLHLVQGLLDRLGDLEDELLGLLLPLLEVELVRDLLLQAPHRAHGLLCEGVAPELTTQRVTEGREVPGQRLVEAPQSPSGPSGPCTRGTGGASSTCTGACARSP